MRECVKVMGWSVKVMGKCVKVMGWFEKVIYVV